MKFNILIVASLIVSITQASDSITIDRVQDKFAEAEQLSLNIEFDRIFWPKLNGEIKSLIVKQKKEKLNQEFFSFAKAYTNLIQGNGYKGKNDTTIYQEWINDFKTFTQTHFPDFVKSKDESYFEFNQESK